MSVYQEVELFLKIAELAGKYGDKLATSAINNAFEHLSKYCFPCGTATDLERAELEKQMQMQDIPKNHRSDHISSDWGNQAIGQLEHPVHAGDASWNIQSELAGSGIIGKAAGTLGFAEKHNTAIGSVVDKLDGDGVIFAKNYISNYTENYTD